MADDYAGDATTTGRLTYSSRTTGVLETSGDVDWFAIALTAGRSTEIDLAKSTTFVGGGLGETLVDASGTRVSNTPAGAGSISLIPSTTGTFYISVASTSGGTGTYTLTTSPADDYVGNTSTTGQLSIGGTTTGVLESVGDTDWYAVSLVSGRSYEFDLTRSGTFIGGGLGETLVDATGTRVPNTSAGASSISFIATASGTFYLSVGSTSGGTGTYTLNSSPFDDYLSNPSTTGQLSIGGTTRGVLESSGDADWFAVSLIAGRSYEFDLTKSTTFIGGGLGETLVDSTGTRVSNTAAGASSISFIAAASGTFYLSVGSTSGGTGIYTLTAAPFDDYTGNASTTGQLNPGFTTSGVLESTGDVDWLSVQLTAGQKYEFDLTKSTAFVGGGLGETLVDASGSRVANTSAGATSISLTASSSGTYFLSVSSTSGGKGTYNVNESNPSLPVYRFFDNTNGTHFFTSDSSERDSIINNQAARYTEETNGYGAVAAGDPNATAVYRFFDTVYGTHFFTASASERDTIQATRPDLTYEPNSTFYEHATQQSGDVAVYRFFDTQYGTHFYTGDASEYAGLTTPGSSTYRTNLTNEGVGFYAPAGTFR